MYIETQCCGLVITAVIAYLTKREKSIFLKSRRLYTELLSSTLLCLSLDILSVIGIVSDDALPRWLVLFFCKIYLCSLVLSCMLGSLYAAEELFHTRRKTHQDTVFERALQIVGIIGMIMPLILPVDYYCDPQSLYSYGPACTATYAFCFAYILITICLCLFKMKSVSQRRRRVILIWQLTYITAAVIQALFPQILIVGFATSVGMFLLYAQLENPAEDIDRDTGCYNRTMLFRYLNDCINSRVKVSGMAIILETEDNLPDPDARRLLALYTANYLHSLNKGIVFNISWNEFVMAFQNESELNEAYDDVREFYAGRLTIAGIDEPVQVRARFYLMPDSSIVEDTDDLVLCHNYYAEKYQDVETICVDEKAVAALHEFEDVKKELSEALRSDRIEVYYQPIYDVKERKFCSAEALVRMRTPDGTIVPPAKFIPAAEATGLVNRLGETVFRKVCELFQSGRLENTDIRCINVNLSVIQLGRKNLAGRILAIMEACHVSSDKINLEITETAKADIRDRGLNTINVLHDHGIHFALDDFGTGRSNLDYFISVPVSIVKFDREFTRSYFENERTQYVMQSMIRMFQDIGLQIVVEGVETEEQLKTMISLGADDIQGYYFARPLPEEAFLSFLEKHRQN